MYNTQILEGRVETYNAKIIAKTNKGIRILDNVYMEATVPMLKFYEPSPVEWGTGYFYYDFAVEIDDIDLDYTEHDNFIIKKVLKVIKADWEVQDEWERYD